MAAVIAIRPGAGRRFVLPIVGLAAVVGAVVLATLVVGGVGFEELSGAARAVHDWLAVRPVVLFVALAVLPAFAVPVSPLLVLAGFVYREAPGGAAAVALPVLAIWANIAWTYAVARIARGWFRGLVEGFGYAVPEASPGSRIPLIVVVRITPGFPLCLQNYLLGLLAVPALPHFLISLPIQGFYAGAIAAGGGALLRGDWAIALGAGALLVGFSLLVREVRRRRAACTDGCADEVATNG